MKWRGQRHESKRKSNLENLQHLTVIRLSSEQVRHKHSHRKGSVTTDRPSRSNEIWLLKSKLMCSIYLCLVQINILPYTGCPVTLWEPFLGIYCSWVILYTRRNIIFIKFKSLSLFLQPPLCIFFFFTYYFIQCEAWEKVLESVSRQARVQRVLKQRLRNPWTQLKSHIVVFN